SAALGKVSYANATDKAETAVIGAVGPEAWMRVPPKIDAMIGITAAPIMPANPPLPDMTPKAAPSEIAAKLTVRPAVRSAENFRQSILNQAYWFGNRITGHGPGGSAMAVRDGPMD